MIKGIIFDMDGTITLTELLHHKAYGIVARDFGLTYPSYEEHMRKFAGSGGKNIFTSVSTSSGFSLSNEQLEDMIQKKRALYKKLIQTEEIPIVEGVKEFCVELNSRNLKRIIATGNADLTAVRTILERVGLSEIFPELVSVKEVPNPKPAPDVFLEALRRIKLQKDEVVVLEDAVNGVKSAHDAGITCIAFSTSTSKDELLAAGASQVLDNYYQLSSILFPK